MSKGKERQPENIPGLSSPPEALPSKEKTLLPAARITVLRSYHAIESDAKGVGAYLQKPGTIYIPECSGWEDETRLWYQAVADGVRHPLQVAGLLEDPSGKMRGFITQILEELHDSGVKIALIDTLKSDQVHKELDESMSPEYKGSFAEVLESVRHNLERFMQLQSEREALMVQRLIQYLRNPLNYQKTDQELTDPLEIVITIGSFHVGLLEKLNAAAPEFSALEVLDVLNHPEEKDTSWEEHAQNQIMTGKREIASLQDELLARILMEKLILSGQLTEQLHRAFPDTIAVSEYVKNLVAQFSVEEIQDFYQKAVEAYQEAKTQGFQVISRNPKEFDGFEFIAGQVLMRKTAQTDAGGWLHEWLEKNNQSLPSRIKPMLSDDEMYNSWV